MDKTPDRDFAEMAEMLLLELDTAAAHRARRIAALEGTALVPTKAVECLMTSDPTSNDQNVFHPEAHWQL